MTHDELLEWSRRAVEWALHYHKGLRDRAVQAQVAYGATGAQLPGSAPETPESMAQIFADFEAIVPDAMTPLAASAQELADAIAKIGSCEIVTPPALSLFTFHYRDDAATQALLSRINDDGRVYLTQTRHKGQFVIRVQVGQFDCTRDDVMM
ncbi:hypothetical protein ACJ5NV_19930 [Loktanella agnita]|uniref:hypothetical protein n=1 Tax=Loktanella agnita TaxID=287097 RepID=UPI0039893F0D